jgi:uncharacterized membrane protein
LRNSAIFGWIFWNVIACVFLGLLIFEYSRRAATLIFLLPLQLIINLAIYAVLKQFKVSGMTVIYVIGLLAGLIIFARGYQWWMLVILLVIVGRIIWSVQTDRTRLRRKEE